ncbi:hypothetical protein L6R52_22065 [Myxococcota bacterium]|nr:hypothetical protein [Myxococcota bacterium]
MHDLRDVGGTKGGLGHFVIGLVLACAGVYLFLDRITVSGGTWSFGSTGIPFGATLVPLIAGVGVLFIDGRSKIGWLLMLAGLLVLVGGMLVNLRLHFRATTLFHTIAMLTFIAAGVGLMIRATLAVGDKQAREEERTAARKAAEAPRAAKRPPR